MILVTKTFDQARHKGHTLSSCTIISCRRHAGNGGDTGGKSIKNVEKKGLVQ